MAKVWTVGEVLALSATEQSGPVEPDLLPDIARAPDRVVERVRARIEARLAAEESRVGR